MFAWHPNEHLLEMWQTFVHVGKYVKEVINEDTTVPQLSKGGT
jgi:hypothetical protein